MPKSKLKKKPSKKPKKSHAPKPKIQKKINLKSKQKKSLKMLKAKLKLQKPKTTKSKKQAMKNLSKNFSALKIRIFNTKAKTKKITWAKPKKILQKNLKKIQKPKSKKITKQKSIPKQKPAPVQAQKQEKYELLIPETQKSLVVQKPTPPLSVPSPPVPPTTSVTTPPAPTPPILADGSINPDLDLLPEWEDRLKLRRIIFEEGLRFSTPSSGSFEFSEATKLFSNITKKSDVKAPGYFVICVKDRTGKLIGALDGHMVSGSVMIIWRSFVKDAKIREYHILLYAAALAVHHPPYVFFTTEVEDFTSELAGRLILLGRGFGMSAIPCTHGRSIVLLRRMKKELRPIATSQEIVQVMNTVKIFGYDFERFISDFEKMETVELIPLPTSPDTLEHLHELRDLITTLDVPAEHLNSVLETLRTQYVLGRKDISPVFLF